MIGKTVSHYEITEKLGQGGMGEVYRANDTKLNRDVALKILPQVFAQDVQRMARFEREAQVLASLNHPNIASIYGLEEANGTKALVMELVEGEDLSERIARGPIPLEEALPIALQIAEALEGAHEKGIIHRDLKPANIKLTRDGKVKILDFGLAKALEEERTQEEISNSPTLTMQATQAGIILGTAAYMSPEQARGKPVDRRTDIWSFGVVLLEMLTGRRVFEGEDLSLTLAAVMKEEPDWESLPGSIPREIRRLLERCLRKEPQTRLRDIGDARIVLNDCLADPSALAETAPRTLVVPQARWRRWLPWATAGTLALFLLALLWHSSEVTGHSHLPRRLSIELGAEIQLSLQSIALSKDGSKVAFLTRSDDGRPMLAIRSLDQLDAFVLPGTEGAYAPFFSPDGRWVCFFTTPDVGRRLSKIAVTGGPVQTLCHLQRSGLGGAWGEDGTIVFAMSRAGLMRVSSAGGSPEPLRKLDEGAGGVRHYWPQVLPGGEALIYTAYGDEGNLEAGQVVLEQIESGDRTILVQGAAFGRYLSSGHLVYLQENTLFAAPLDLQHPEVRQPVPVLEDVDWNRVFGAGELAIAEDGTLIYLSAGVSLEDKTLSWVNRLGEKEPLLTVPNDYRHIRISPDGRQLLLEINDGQIDIWSYDFERETLSRLTFSPALDGVPVWAPDSSGFVFASNREGHGIYWKRSDGSGEAVRLTESERRRAPYSWHPSGRFLAFWENNPETGQDIGIYALERNSESGWKLGEPEYFLQTRYDEWLPAFSPDGRWLAYRSNESGQHEIYVRPFPSGGGKWQVSSNGGGLPTWVSNGQGLVYFHNDQFWEVPYTVEGGSFRPERPRLWTEQRFELWASLRSYDLHPDNERMALFQGAGEKLNHAVLFENFFEYLKAQVPVDP